VSEDIVAVVAVGDVGAVVGQGIAVALVVVVVVVDDVDDAAGAVEDVDVRSQFGFHGGPYSYCSLRRPTHVH